jgi:hypothetical protein
MINGELFSARSAYACLHHSDSVVGTEKIWATRVPNKVKVFGWLDQLDRINTRANLHKKNIITISECPVCLGVIKDRLHLFFECPAASAVLRRARINLNLQSFDELWEQHSSLLPSALVWPSIALLLLWKIWDSVSLNSTHMYLV